MASDAWPEDIPIWIDGTQKWMTGLTRRTTCDDVIYALLYARGLLDTDSTDNYAVFERWRAVERPLQGRTKIVKVWSTWGAEQPNVQLLVQRLDDYFMPPEGAAKARRRHHRRSNRQRARHSANCRCVGRPQCAKCGRLKAVEHLAKHLVKQERHLEDLKRRVHDTDRQIAEHETRQHARRMQRDGRDYVQDSYLFHYGSDNSSSSASEDSIDYLLLSIGEEALDEYLNLYDRLYDVVNRLEHAKDTQQSLAHEIEETVPAVGETDEPDAQDWEARLEALHVQVTRAVAANILQQQQELDVAKELRMWEAKIRDRKRMTWQLEHELERENQQVIPPPFTDSGISSSSVYATESDSLFSPGEGHSTSWQQVPSAFSDERFVNSDTVDDRAFTERCNITEDSSGDITSQPDADQKWSPSQEPPLPPRCKSHSRDKTEKSIPPLPAPRLNNNLGIKAATSTELLHSRHSSSVDKLGYDSMAPSIPKTTDEANKQDSNTRAAFSDKVPPLRNDCCIYPEPHGHAVKEYSMHPPYSRSNGNGVRRFDYVRGHSSMFSTNHALPFPSLASRQLEMYSSCRDDSGVSSSDSSTDSAVLIFDGVDHTDGISDIGRRKPSSSDPSSDPDSFLDVSVSYSVDGGEQSSKHSTGDSSSWKSGFTMNALSSSQFDYLDPSGDLEPQSSTTLHGNDGVTTRFAGSVGKSKDTNKWPEGRNGLPETLPVSEISQRQRGVSEPVSIISGRNKGKTKSSSAHSRVKTVRFADEMTSWWVCDDADSSDDTGLSSLHDDDALETLV